LALKNREQILQETQSLRVEIKSDALHGSIFLKGARFDDLTLARYFETQKEEKEVVLFAPAESRERYFTDFGFLSSNSNLDLPTPDTVWQSDSNKLTPNNPVTLSWKNKQNIEFQIKISLDENYMFNVTQKVKNNSGGEISLASYGRISRVLNKLEQSNYILHEGAIGAVGGVVKEVSYKDLIEDKKIDFNDSGENNGWLGITDKYWLSSLIPDRGIAYSGNFSYEFTNQNSLFSSEFIGEEFLIAKGDSFEFKHNLFAGAKKVKLLDKYAKDYNIKLFDRAIDFGWFYFLTKPFFFIVDFLNKFLGNFGLAILAMTVLIKLALFPMASKSYMAIARIKKLQPKIEALRERFKDDKLSLNREMMELYKREKVNPASGCLPIIVQIPIFFALYKVLFVTLDMRQAPFYGWIKDLSAPDPTSIFNLFGLLPFEVSGYFAIGLWPILMGLTMYLQQKLSPTSGDATQAKILRWMPVVLTFVLASFPAGLVIYWTWSNTLSVLQQWFITRKTK
jgi:YidC/Oxa1 family membrane protein insertase